MSAGRPHRRRLAAARLQRTLDESWEQPAVFVKSTPIGEVWMRGQVMLVIPHLLDDDHPEVKDAYDRRRRADLRGRCDCGAVQRVKSRRLVALHHEHGCPASDEGIRELLQRHGSPA